MNNLTAADLTVIFNAVLFYYPAGCSDSTYQAYPPKAQNA